jgi:hypothetical protein
MIPEVMDAEMRYTPPLYQEIMPAAHPSTKIRLPITFRIATIRA